MAQLVPLDDLPDDLAPSGMQAVPLDDLPDDLAPAKPGAMSMFAQSIPDAAANLLGGLYQIPNTVLRGVDAAKNAADSLGRAIGVPESLLERKYVGPDDLVRPFIQGQQIGDYRAAGLNDVGQAVANLGDLVTSQPYQDEKKRVGKAANLATDAALDGNFSPLGDVLTDPNTLAVGAGQAIPSLYASIRTGGALAPLLGMGVAGAEQDLQKFERKNGAVSPEDGVNAVLGQGLLTAGAERLGLKALASGLPAPLAKMVFKDAAEKTVAQVPKTLAQRGGAVLGAGAGESITEIGDTIGGNLIKQQTYDPNQKLTDDALLAGIGGAGSGLGMRGGLEAFDAVTTPSRVVPKDDLPDDLADAPAPPPQAVQPTPEPEPVAPPEPVKNPRARTVTTSAGRKVDTEFEVVDLSTLQAAEGDLQNRDRSRATSDVQIRGIASGLDPERLSESAEADRGAPIVGPDNTIESGNGRVRGIELAYGEFPEQSKKYRDYLTSQGYDTTGIERPVLIRRRKTEMTDDERRAFVIEANQSATMGLSSVERAQSDADLIDDNTLSQYRGGDVSQAGNAGFVQAFVGRMNPAERAQMVAPDGSLSQDGSRRLEAALMARAYGNPELLTKLLEDRDNNIKSVGGAFLDQSGSWSRLRAAVKSGRVKKEFDVTDNLVEAARILSQLREKGMKLSTYLQQTDAFTKRDPVTEAFLTAFYNKGMTRAAGRESISDTLARYADRAQEQTTDAALFEMEDVTPQALLQDILGRREEKTEEPTLFEKAPELEADDDGADIPAAVYAKTKVMADVFVTDENTTEQIEVSAREAIESVREDIANLKKLLDCMKG